MIKKSLCTPAVRYNLPKSYWDVIPTVTCGDPNKSLWESLLTTLMNALPVEMGFEIFGELTRRAGLSDADARRIRAQVENGELPQNTVAGTGGTKNGAAP